MNIKPIVVGILLFSQSVFALSAANPVPPVSNLSIEVEVPKQAWQFEIKYGLLSQEKARLAVSEKDISKQLKPMLNQGQYQQAWQVVKDIDTSQSSAALAQVKGQIAYQVNDYQAAIPAFEDALTKRPDLIASHRGLAGIYLKQSNQKSALKHLTQAIVLGDQDASIFAQMGYLHMQNEQAYAAIAGFRQALFLAPDREDYKRGLLWALTQSGDVQESLHLLSQMIEQTPDDASLWLQLSQIQLLQGDETKALSSLDVARRLGDTATNNLMLSAQLHLNHGSAQQAIFLLKQVLKADSQQYKEPIIAVLSVLVNKGDMHHAQQLSSALNKYKNKLDHKAQSQLLTYQGVLAHDNNKLKQAEQLFQQAINKDAANGNAMLKLGLLLQAQQKYSRADSYFVRASSFAPYQEMAWLSIAQIAIEQGSYERAISFLNKAYKANPARRDLIANIKQLERLQRAM